MNRLIAIVFTLVIASCLHLQAQDRPDSIANDAIGIDSTQIQTADLNTLWDAANTAYINSQFDQAIDTYNKILEGGNSSAKLYYNLAGAHYKKGNLAHAILNYRRALFIDPSDKDCKYNLQVVSSLVKDRIEEVPVFFVARIIKDIRAIQSSNGWCVTAVIMFALMAALILLYLLADRNALRKVGFFGALAAFILFIASVCFSVSQYNNTVNNGEAVVMSSAVAAKSSPDVRSKDIFILHEGTVVTIIGELGDWKEILIADGNKGWLPSNSIERVVK